MSCLFLISFLHLALLILPNYDKLRNLSLKLQAAKINRFNQLYFRTAGVVQVPLQEQDSKNRLLKTEQDFISVMNSGGPALTRWVGPHLLALIPSFFLRPFLRTNIGTGIIFTSVLGPSDKTLWIGSNRIQTVTSLLGPQYAQTGNTKVKSSIFIILHSSQ